MEINARPVIVEEHCGNGQACGDCGKTHHCPIPEDILKAGLVSPRLTALIGGLKGARHMSVTNILNFRLDVIGVRISRGMIQKLVQNVRVWPFPTMSCSTRLPSRVT